MKQASTITLFLLCTLCACQKSNNDGLIELDDHKLIMSADDKMILLFVEVNDLNQNGQKKIVGGSAFEEFKR